MTTPARSTPQFSTIVRNFLKLLLLRLQFAVIGRLLPGLAAGMAARLFCRPFPSARRRALAAPTCGADETELDSGGTTIHVYSWGDPRLQPYVLFAHGWSSHGTRVTPWLPHLRGAGYAVVAFDQVAHGRSDGNQATLPEFADHLAAVGRHFGPAAAIIGHSLGGAAAMLALADGLEAARAILIAPAADPVAAAERFSRVIRLPQHLARRMFIPFERRMHFDVDSLQVHRNAPRIGRPALIVHDMADREVPWHEGERYARFWPDSRLLTTIGLGHHRITDDAGVIAAGLRFLHGEVVGDHVVSSTNLPYGLA
ncbi:MAG: alpha/beta hydrolase [Proteobacteria bacterium]|nr:alpha/beta hydrolase [Pseudomonadota bacterium]